MIAGWAMHAHEKNELAAALIRKTAGRENVERVEMVI
jgi:hypothetical protein